MNTQILFILLFVYSATGQLSGQPGEDVQVTSGGGFMNMMDIELFSGEGVWMYDDDGKLVRATLEFDNETNRETEEESNREMEKRVMFLLYTQRNPKEAQPLYLHDGETLARSNFNPQRPTRFITHGWLNSRKSPACTLIRDAYLKKDDYNVIVIDWSRVSSRPYLWAASRVKMVGIFVSYMVNFLARAGMNVSDTKLIGHSLGAHVAGLAARYSKYDINCVVGLDPALPSFLFSGPGERISKGDAAHVEIIHTNAGLLGYLSAIGDIDFYPNGGYKQVGCLIDIGGACSHCRSYEFYAESINSPVKFYARNCNNYFQYSLGLCNSKQSSIMGEGKTTLKDKGTYYLTTKSAFPYAKGL